MDETTLGAEVSVDGGRIVYTRPVGEGEPFVDAFEYAISDGRGGSAGASVVVFDGQPVPPTLSVEPSETEPRVAPDFAFATRAPFPRARGVAQDDLILDRGRAVRIELLRSDAEFDNSLGWYRIEDGAPVDPQILFANVKEVDGTTPTAVGLGTLPADAEFGFFLAQDGFARNGALLDPAAEFAFRGDPGSLQLFRIDGEHAIDGDILHTVDAFNPGGLTQTVSGLNDLDAFTIGFEDKVRADPAQGSDDEFNDAVFTLGYGNVVPPGPGLAVEILDPDSTSMSSARVTITAATRQPGDRLFLDDALDREGDIVLSGEGTDRLELTGPASTEDFERVLEAVELEVDRTGPERELAFQVVDTDGQPGNIDAVVVATATASRLDVLLDVSAANLAEVA